MLLNTKSHKLFPSKWPICLPVAGVGDRNTATKLGRLRLKRLARQGDLLQKCQRGKKSQVSCTLNNVSNCNYTSEQTCTVQNVGNKKIQQQKKFRGTKNYMLSVEWLRSKTNIEWRHMVQVLCWCSVKTTRNCKNSIHRLSAVWQNCIFMQHYKILRCDFLLTVKKTSSCKI